MSNLLIQSKAYTWKRLVKKFQTKQNTENIR